MRLTSSLHAWFCAISPFHGITARPASRGFGVVLFALAVGTALLGAGTVNAQSVVSEIKDSNGNTVMTVFDNGVVEPSSALRTPTLEGTSGVTTFNIPTDLEIVLEPTDNPSVTSFFEIFNTGGTNLFSVRETGATTIGGPLTVNDQIESTSGGIVLPDGTVLQNSSDVGGGGLSLPFSGSASTGNPAFEVENTGSGHGLRVVNSGDDGLRVDGAASDGVEVQGADWGFYTTGVNEDGVLVNSAGDHGIDVNNPSNNGIDVAGAGTNGINVTGSGNRAGYFEGSGGSTTDAVVEISETGSGDGLLIDGAGSDAIKISNSNYGVFVESSTTDGLLVSSEGDGIDVEGDSDGDGTGLAGDFDGDVDVNGTLNANNKNFKIDHPQDPTGKYLKHSTIESPNRLNAYTGNVTLDGNGEATVQLPDYFESINRDYRYQLTAIGAAAPRLHVAQEVNGNEFRIGGGKPGMKVSWRVTAIRDDAWSQQHPFQPEVEKPAKKQGTYRNPKAHGAPESRGESVQERRQEPVSQPKQVENESQEKDKQNP